MLQKYKEIAGGSGKASKEEFRAAVVSLGIGMCPWLHQFGKRRTFLRTGMPATAIQALLCHDSCSKSECRPTH